MDSRPSAIGGYEDWPAFVRQSRPGPSGTADSSLALMLGVPALPQQLPSVQRGRASLVDGILVTPLRWQLPYGPPTSAFLVTPEQQPQAAPGVLWMHCHGGEKWLGAERLVDLGSESSAEAAALRGNLYEGRAVANELARTGMAVLVHDPFSWGSRRFDLDPAPRRAAAAAEAQRSLWAVKGHAPSAAELYNAAAAEHENTVAKVSGMLGTSYAGMVAYDDLVALAVLRSLPEVDATSVGAGGFSGGGGRALTLAALDAGVRACVVTCMMTTVEQLFPAYLDAHSWLHATPGLAAVFDQPDVWALSEAELLVQFAREDDLFPLAGMQDADDRLQHLSRSHPSGYRGSWHSGGHVMTAAMQEEAFAFLQDTFVR
jgi:dienelactone hydrolase